eukprot:m.203327 g.203327  ORF g.203327 m.203327 type:complete len:905 (-) comp32852_c6_seq6:235-2949(-)
MFNPVVTHSAQHQFGCHHQIRIPADLFPTGMSSEQLLPKLTGENGTFVTFISNKSGAHISFEKERTTALTNGHGSSDAIVISIQSGNRGMVEEARKLCEDLIGTLIPSFKQTVAVSRPPLPPPQPQPQPQSTTTSTSTPASTHMNTEPRHHGSTSYKPPFPSSSSQQITQGYAPVIPQGVFTQQPPSRQQHFQPQHTQHQQHQQHQLQQHQYQPYQPHQPGYHQPHLQLQQQQQQHLHQHHLHHNNQQQQQQQYQQVPQQLQQQYHLPPRPPPVPPPAPAKAITPPPLSKPIGPSLPWLIPEVNPSDKKIAKLTKKKRENEDDPLNTPLHASGIKFKRGTQQPFAHGKATRNAIEDTQEYQDAMASVKTNDLAKSSLTEDVKPVLEPPVEPLVEPLVEPTVAPTGPTLEELASEEAAHEENLLQYKEQLAEVNAMLGMGVVDPQLSQLVADLQELERLTEGQLMATKKALLLAVMAQSTTEPEQSATKADTKQAEKNNHFVPGELTADAMSKMWGDVSADDEDNKKHDSNAKHGTKIKSEKGSKPATLQGSESTSTATELQKHEDPELEKLFSSAAHCLIAGDEIIPETRCAAPYCAEWGGGWQYHNAIVHTVDHVKETCNVLFTCPRHKKMMTCPRFLSEKCKKSADQCEYSHGYAVQMDRIREFTEPNFDSLKVGGKLLVKYRDGLWYTAVLLKIVNDKSELKCKVRFVDYDAEGFVATDEMLPFETVKHDNDEDDIDVDGGHEVVALDSDHDDSTDFVPHAMSGVDAEYAGWEVHTRGIGSKLMAKMGHVKGRGLGKKSDGKVSPVRATVLPAGKTIDYCLKLTKNGVIKSTLKEKNWGGYAGTKRAQQQLQKQQQQQHLQTSAILTTPSPHQRPYLTTSTASTTTTSTPSTPSPVNDAIE